MKLVSRRVSADWLFALMLFAAAFALYARTAAPGLLDGDEGEFQTNIARLGVSHTGYPLFFLLGKLWTILVPIGTLATRANLFAAFWGALAVVAIFVFTRFLVGNRWVALLCALLCAVSRVEWSQAIIPRPYTLNSLFVVLVALFFFLWRIGKVDLSVPVFLVGLSLTNHRTMIWFAPAIAFLVLWKERAALFQPRRLFTLAAAFALPLLLYGYVFWRGDSDVGVEFHLKDFNDMILAGNASRWMRYGPLDWLISRVTDLYIPLLIEQFTPLGFVAGLIGMIALALDRVPRGWQRDLPAREALLFIALANIGNSAFCVFFWTIDVEKFFLPSYITFLFFVGVGIAIVWDWLAARRAGAQIIIVLAFVGAVGFLLASNYTQNDFSHRTDAITTWNENLAQPLEQNALIVGPWETLTPLEYAQYVDHRRTDLERWKVIVKQEQVSLTLYGSRQADIERAVRAGRPVYLTVHPRETETLGALADEFRVTRVGELWRVVNCEGRGASCGMPVRASGAVFRDSAGRAIELQSYAVFPATNLRAGDFGLLMLAWRAPQSLSARFTISLRVVDAQDRVVYQRDAEPANGLRPTIGWVPEEIVQDDAGFFVPPDAAPGAYRLMIVVYNPANGEELRVAESASLRVVDLKVTQ
ncbi:MAG: DUF2723 domain-containing protein [Chloroflexota bacterium]